MPKAAARAWNNAGGAALAGHDYKDALADFLKARESAGESGEPALLTAASNNLASLYLQTGNPGAAVQVARAALGVPATAADAATRPKLQFQLASALAALHLFDEAAPIYRQAINALYEQGDLDATVRVLSTLGDDALNENRPEEAEAALSEALRLVRVHHVNASANVLRGLAVVKSRAGDRRSAALLFDAAIAAPQNITPRWVIFADRGEFRLAQQDLAGALSDFREARRLAAAMRIDSVRADGDRVALERGLSRLAAGLVTAGNRLALKTANTAYLRETFDTAEEDRLWSMRALIPVPNDWRTRLPRSYWSVLARYQNIERTILGESSPSRTSAQLKKEASSLQLLLQQMEAAAAYGGIADAPGASLAKPTTPESASTHVRNILDPDSVLFSFHISSGNGWLWAVDARGVDVYPVPALEALKPRVADFARAVRTGAPGANALGSALYKDLFGSVPAAYVSHKRWLLELDGPLFDLPFAALIAGTGGAGSPIFLIEKASLEVIPGALMLERRSSSTYGEFLGVGDAIYNAADARYRGVRKAEEIVLPRLQGTASELEACARAWGMGHARNLTGAAAELTEVRTALQSNPSVIHFATHVITAPGEQSSGLIALSLDPSGAMGLLGPTEIVAHPLTAALVVLNGCHSGQGESIPGSGLMGLTRAWLGAGAKAVLATQWDIGDESGKKMMVEFYRFLRANPGRGPAAALREAQAKALNGADGERMPAAWAAYFLSGRQ